MAAETGDGSGEWDGDDRRKEDRRSGDDRRSVKRTVVDPRSAERRKNDRRK